MSTFDPSELILIRHAPAATEGRLCGRVDVPLRGGDDAAMDRVRTALHGIKHVVSSPALRCRQTAQAVFPTSSPAFDPRFWEQDFGAEDGMLLRDLPDLGPMSRNALAARRPPDGESFADMAARVGPALEAVAQMDNAVAIVAHAGTVRAGLALALGTVPAALAFEVAPLSVTRLRRFTDSWSIIAVNVTY